MFGLERKIPLFFGLLLLFAAFAYAGTVTRSFSTTSLETGQNLTVTLAVDETGETYYAIDETIPSGWTISDAGSGLTDEAGHLKWVVYENAVDTSYDYILTATSSGTSNLSGIYMFEGMTSEQTVAGQTQVTVTAPPQCTVDANCPGQICCSQMCVNPTCSLDADCDDSNSATSDACNNAGTCTASCSNTLITNCIDGDGYCPPTCDENTDSDCLVVCGNGVVEAGETCENCPADVSCGAGDLCCSAVCTPIVCTVNPDCGSGHICIDGGTCTATCQIGCEISDDCLAGQICCSGSCAVPTCSLDADCDDLNVATLDSCISPGACDANCSNTLITTCTHGDGYCPPTCDESTDGDCMATCGNFEVDVGENCGNCPMDVNCSGGQVCCNDACATPTCLTSAGCNDGDSCTTDTCNNPGLCTASCSNVSIAGCGGTPAPPGPGPSPGPSPGPGGNRMTVNIEGSCLGQPITLTVLNQQGNPMKDVDVRLVKDRVTVETRKTPDNGRLSYSLEEEGEYLFYLTKEYYYAESKQINVTTCIQPEIHFEPELDAGQDQVITLIGEDGNAIREFTVTIVFPDKTTLTLTTQEGAITIPTDVKGIYTATIWGDGFEETITFEAKKPLQLVPDISPAAQPAISAVFGAETVAEPNYLIIWILAIAVISGLIIQVTKLKPGWFRIFMASTYTTLPLVVNHYAENIWFAFAIIAIETTILTAMYFKQWKTRKVNAWMKKLETNTNK